MVTHLLGNTEPLSLQVWKGAFFYLPILELFSSDKGKGQIWLVVTPQGLWGVNDGLFSPEWRGKRLHDIEIQSATWTTNPEVLRLFHKVALKVGLILPWLYSTVSLSLPGLSAILILSLPFFCM